jgi:transporter family protein
LALVGRIVLLGLERVFVKRLGEGRGSVETTFVFFGLAALYLLPVAAIYGPPRADFLRFALPSGVIYSFAFVLYVNSLSTGEVSLVSPLANLNSLFLLVLAALIYGEPFSLLKLAGTVAIILGASMLRAPGGPRASARRPVSRHPAGGFIALVRYPPALAMIGYAALLAVTRVIDKGGLGVINPVTYSLVIYSTITVCLGILLALQGRLRKAWELLLDRPVTAFLAGIVNAYSYLLLLYAIVGLPLSVAEPVSSLSLFVTAFLGAVMFGEKVKGRLGAAALIVLGSWLLVWRG